MQYITAMMCVNTHKKIREIGGALGKIDMWVRNTLGGRGLIYMVLNEKI